MRHLKSFPGIFGVQKIPIILKITHMGYYSGKPWLRYIGMEQITSATDEDKISLSEIYPQFPLIQAEGFLSTPFVGIAVVAVIGAKPFNGIPATIYKAIHIARSFF
jgi:hypothetical protein